MIPSPRSPASRQLVCNLGHARARTLGSSLGPAVASISSHHVSHSTSPLGCFNGTRRTSSTRFLHSSTNRPKPTDHLTIDNASSLSSITGEPPQPISEKMPTKTPSPLAVLPLTNVLRSWMTTTVSSSPLLLPPSLAAMSILAHTTNPALNPDRNPLLRAFLKKTFYAQFCAGENPAEVRQTIDSLKQIGFSGVILGYAREVVLSDSETANLEASFAGSAAEDCVRNEITPWAEGTMETVRLASPGDFVALKFTGAGRQALYSLSKRLPPSEALGGAIDGICKLAAERGVRLLFDAEQTALQAGIDDWTLEYMRRYNSERGVVYGTSQAYLKSTPSTLSKHLAIAAKEGFTLGVKLVRGAYLGSDPRHLICDTKEDTDRQYDGIAESLLRKSWSAPLQPPAPRSEKEMQFPEVNVVLATHNRDSVLHGKALLDSGKSKLGYDQVAFAQLQGMADEVSCELVFSPHETSSKMEMVEKQNVTGKEEGVNKPQVYKYLVWGSTGECMKYLLRRAYENRDAVQRTRSGREAMGREVVRRVKGMFGLSG